MIHADQASVAHPVRKDVFAPRSRETAQHSPPCIVTAACSTGTIPPASSPTATRTAPCGYSSPSASLSRRTHLSRERCASPFRLAGAHCGRASICGPQRRPGTPDETLQDDHFAAKMYWDGDLPLGPEGTTAVVDAIWSLEDVGDVRAIAKLLLA